MVRCHSCGWEGKEEELVEKPGNLMFYDYMAQETFKMEVTRISSTCPKCGEVLKSRRLVGGVPYDR
jgi:predicted RNA-binding Zn-ribbon protein involved in translation (DUF1610 family)